MASISAVKRSNGMYSVSPNISIHMTDCPSSLPVRTYTVILTSVSCCRLSRRHRLRPGARLRGQRRSNSAPDILCLLCTWQGGHSSVSNKHAFERRSYFGLFIRRCYLSFFKLSWRGAVKLLADYKDWIDGKDAGYNLRTTDRDGGQAPSSVHDGPRGFLTPCMCLGLLLVPTISDEVQYAQIDPYEKCVPPQFFTPPRLNQFWRYKVRSGRKNGRYSVRH